MHYGKKKKDWDSIRPYVILILGGLLIRLLAVGINRGHPTDINCFYAWADMLFRDGLRAFYASPAFTDYPPGYMYVLYVIGFLRDAFGLSYNGFAHNLLIKTPAMLADVGLGVLLFRIAVNHAGKTQRKASLSPLAIAALYVFNPLTIMLSAVWGQVDSIYGLFLLWSLYLLTEKKDTEAYLVYAAAILVKPQALMFGPVFIVRAVLRLKEHRFHSAELAGFLFRCVLSLIFIIAALLPFMGTTAATFYDTPLGREIVLAPVLQQLLDTTVASYPYCSVNAYNLYGLLGLNWRPLTDTFMGLSYGAWGVLALAAAAIGGSALILMKRDKWSIYYAAAFICVIVFTLSTRMHERYTFPIFVLLPAAYALRGDRKILWAWAGMLFASFLNCADALRLALSGWDYSLIDRTSRVFSFVWMAAFAWFIAVTLFNYRKNAQFKDFKPVQPIPFSIQGLDAPKNDTSHRLKRPDYILMCVLTAVYAIVAFTRLGDREAPETAWTPPFNGEAVFDLGVGVTGAELWIYSGARHEQDFLISLSADGHDFTFIGADDFPRRFSTGSVFRWSSHYLHLGMEFRYVKITSAINDLMLMEAAFKDHDGQRIPAVCLTPGAAALNDEQRLLPDRVTYMNGTYFDEIYHPRTAYEIIHQLHIYETTHPPLGKVIIASGIGIFGMNPFGWRFMGTLAGVLMVPLIYIFARDMFKSSFIAFFTAFVFAFDFMHYVQTRLATIDSYIVLFIILQYYFMYKYYKTSFFAEPLRKTLVPLFLSGIFMGLGIAVKWTGMYAGLGLALIFCLTVWSRYREYCFARSQRIQGFGGFWRNVRITFLCCFVFFVVVPVIIYTMSYIPQYRNAEGLRAFLTAVWDNQQLMLSYHGMLVAEHAYSSPWWSWPLMLRPMWYYSGRTAEGLREGISAFGNPAVWWGGIAAFAYTLYKYFKTRDKIALFLIIGYIAQFIPWMYVSRIVFIYHYFTCIPFITLMLGYAAHNIQGREFNRNGVKIRGVWFNYTFLALTALLFIMFYPVLTGTPVDSDFVDRVLRWMRGWVLV
ncbi:MAG: phospholipid carrier-dependent glycosyltransferase [Defluviitaleaceae bacterium]|nr:phospholipid carrier-dependent glycosyltransferase [Defluviitaleaceae bacterium]MCL2835475.1 phospholipid carrier-dependent glycosyltransferase [Defluviitaleaceae bacterium]